MQRKIAEVVQRHEVYHLPPNAAVLEAARLMKAKACGAVLVMHGNRLDGIFTERDLVERVVAAELDPAHTKLADVMTAHPDSVRADSPALDALRMMEDGGYRHLPVTNGRRVVAVVSRRDFYGEEKARLDREREFWEHIG